MQEAEERSKAAAVKHESCLQQLSAEHAHTLELDSQIEDQHKVSCAATYHDDDDDNNNNNNHNNNSSGESNDDNNRNHDHNHDHHNHNSNDASQLMMS